MPAGAQDPADATARPTTADQIAAAKKAYDADLGAADRRVLAAIDAKIKAVENTTASLNERSAEAERLRKVKDAFVQGELPSKDFPEVVRRFHADVAQARRKHRKDVKAIASRVQVTDRSAAVAIVSELNKYCPQLVDESRIVSLLKPELAQLENRRKPHKDVVKVRNEMTELIEGVRKKTLTAEQLTDRCGALLDLLEGSEVTRDKTKMSQEEFLRLRDGLRKLLDRD